MFKIASHSRFARLFLLSLCLVVCSVSTILATSDNAAAAEARCRELGTSCICSEPFNSNQLQRNSYWFNPLDSISKSCSTGTINNGAIEANPIAQVQMRNDSQAIKALPKGNRVRFFAAGKDNHEGVFFAGHTLARNNFKRIAARYYIYHSPDFQFKDDGACENSKMMSLGILGIDKSFGNPHAYNFTSFSCATQPCPLPRDCCWIGPSTKTLEKPDWRGKWWRVELVVTNPRGPGFDLKLYMKNVTDNRPEFTAIDTSKRCVDCGAGGGWIPSKSIIAPATLNRLLINNYRQGNCQGWLGFSHYLAAGWLTNRGQRIGAAKEIGR